MIDVTYAKFQELAREFSWDSPHTGKISYEWQTGGESGGSCWDEGPVKHYALSSDHEPAPGEIIQVALAVIPDLTYTQIMRIMGATEVSMRQVNEYYGNWRELTTRSIGVRQLYDLLTDMESETAPAARPVIEYDQHHFIIGQFISYESRYDNEPMMGVVSSLGDYADRVVITFGTGTTISVEARWCRLLPSDDVGAWPRP